MVRPLAFILLLIFVLLASPAGILGSLLAQQLDFPSSERLNEVDFKVNTVGLNASYDDVRQRLGAPQRTQRVKVLTKACGGPHTLLTLYYPGLKIELYGTPGGRNFRVADMHVTSTSWEVALGISIDMDEADVWERLGEPGINLADSGGRAFIYKTKGNTYGVGLIFRARSWHFGAWE